MGVDVEIEQEGEDVSTVQKYIKKEWIDREKIIEKGLIEEDQVAYFDETHIDQECGVHQDSTLIFPKNSDGIYDKDGEIDKEEMEKVSTAFVIFIFKMLINYLPFLYLTDQEEAKI